MTRDLPVDDKGELLMAGDKRHLWVAFDEKGAAAAFPKVMSGADDDEKEARGYGRMDGGWAGTAMEMLTGSPSTSYTLLSKKGQKADDDTTGLPVREVWNTMRDAWQARKLLCVGTPGDDPTDYSKSANRKKSIDLSPLDARTLGAMKIVTGHEYSVWDLTWVGGDGKKHFASQEPDQIPADIAMAKCGVVCRNPWGSTEPGNDGKDDGIFELPLATFLRCFESLDVGGPLPPLPQHQDQ